MLEPEQKMRSIDKHIIMEHIWFKRSKGGET